jgi:hypothetical protein
MLALVRRENLSWDKQCPGQEMNPGLPTYEAEMIHSSTPVSVGNMFPDLPRLHETADNIKRYI